MFIQIEDKEPPRTLRSVIFLTLPMFMGYAILVTDQSNLKKQIYGTNDANYLFSFAVSMIYLMNLVFRFAHNVIFAAIAPSVRIEIAYFAMIIANCILPAAYYWLNSTNLAWVFIAYILGGIAIGTFEPNIMAVVHGHNTKVWAQFGISLGFGSISIGAFLIFQAFNDVYYIYAIVYYFVAILNICAVTYFGWYPDRNITTDISTASAKEWFVHIRENAVYLAITMLSVSLASGAQLYIYKSSSWIPIDIFRAVFNTFSMLGDLSGRKLGYKTIMPVFVLPILALVGLGCVLSTVLPLAPFGMFLLMHANAHIYARTTKYVDSVLVENQRLSALSAWLFFGDIGSFIGANIVAPISNAL